MATRPHLQASIDETVDLAAMSGQTTPHGPPRAGGGAGCPELPIEPAVHRAGASVIGEAAGPLPALAFGLGELRCTAEAMAAAHLNGVQVVALVLRHLSCDWGDVDVAAAADNDSAVAAGAGELRSVYRLSAGEVMVVVTDAARHSTTVALT